MALMGRLGSKSPSGRLAVGNRPTVGPFLSAAAVGELCTVVPYNFPANTAVLVRWGDSTNSEHQTNNAGSGAWTHTYGASREYVISARYPSDPNTVIASTTVTIVKPQEGEP